jgi:cytochrome c553
MNANSRSLAGTALDCLPIVIVLCVLAANTVPAPTAKAAAAKPAPAAAAAAAPPCDACHGAHGEGMAAAHVPRLAGQAADYLQKQLDDYASGTRDNPIMANFAKALSEQRRVDFAARYASMSAPYIAQTASPDAMKLARGHQLAYQGDETKRVQACNGCHGPDGVGVAHTAPYLAGQSAEYLESALKAFRDGTRKNDAGQLMRSVAQRLDDADIAAVAGYFGSLD